ncbi:nitroreductase [Sphingobacterium sp. ML3W]|uniref:nitroreductase family protein n=1 Tax=Sphingobacterium sp. ML3W TaxID=1538644 RepID=UPI0004F7C5EE|nr:nitroreductase family protein [Sphingobacterium sp. ML3W]AIM38352.1 nitroreductase [Sphingobacterium sp. ML3W]
MSLIEDLNWRYATKKMNGTMIPQEKLDYILEAARMAPSSSGLQQYKIIVISDKGLLERIKRVAYNQSQVTECSHLLVFAAWDEYTDQRVSTVFNYTMDQRDLPYSTMDDYKTTILNLFSSRGKEWEAHHAAKQSYISFAMAIAAAAEQKIDATPIEGFDSDTLDELLKLTHSGYKSTVILPLGYRDAENDWLLDMKKVRTPRESFITEMTLEDIVDLEDLSRK